MAMVLPDSFSVDVTVKIGEPLSNTRKSVGEVRLVQFVIAEGYAVFQEKLKALVAQDKSIRWSDKSPIMVKPTTNATQAQYEVLAMDGNSLVQQTTRLWNMATRRKTGQGAFKLDVYIYVSRVTTNPSLRRATQARIESASTLINEHLASTDTGAQYGPASRSYWAITHARQPDQTPVAVPSNETFIQLQNIDRLQQTIDTRTQVESVEPDFFSVRCRINDGVIALELNVEDVRLMLGLPSYPYRPPFRDPIAVDPPSENMEDVDHREFNEHV